jgi:hypothetical protein
VRLTARTSAVSTGSSWLDRLLAGPGFLDAEAFPDIGFRPEMLAWVPAGWRAVGRLQVKGAEHVLRGHRARVNGRDHRRRPVLARIAQWQPDQGAAAAARAVSALALSALAVIHVVDLPGTLGPTPLARQ